MIPSSASSEDNGNGKITLALIKQSIDHIIEKIDDQEERANARLAEYIVRAEVGANDREIRIRALEKCTTALDTKINGGYVGTGLTALLALALKLIGGGS